MKSGKMSLAEEKRRFKPIEPRCRYFGLCGGCSLQDLAYEDQLALKKERLRRSFALLKEAPPVDVIGLEEPWRYRNKAEFTFGESDGRMILGYHAERSFWRIIDLEDCWLLPDVALRSVREALALAQATGLPSYQPRTHRGFFRYLLVRYAQASGQLLLCLITSSGDSATAGRAREIIGPLAQELRRRQGSLTSFYWGLTDRLADVALPERLELMEGEAEIEDRIGPFRLRVPPLGFLQPSTAQAERIYAALEQALGESAHRQVAWDLYCGLGAISFHLSRRFEVVYGIDVEPRHIELAARGAADNGIANVRFQAGSAESLLMDRRFWLQEAKPDAIVLDPPRSGLHAQALSSVLAAKAERIAYLSCNVSSLIRDLRLLLSSFPRYRLARLQAFDMFPQTNHVEVLALLERS